MQKEPEVSVVLMTYNHESYVAQAIRSVLEQEADFAVELLVTEDCSTDRTRDVIREAISGHESRVRLFLSERNRCDNEVAARAIRAARGRYLAFLDGDDFWTSPDKLQRQVAFLRANPDCSMCFHAVDVRYEARVQPGEPRRPPPAFARRLAMDDLLEYNHIPGCSPLIRAQALREIPGWFTDAEFGDWPLYLLAAARGPIGYLDQAMGVYRVHRGGFWSAAHGIRQYHSMIAFWERAGSSFGSTVATRVRHLQSKRWMTVADWMVEAEDGAAARRAIARSLRLSPVNPLIGGARRLRVLARVAKLSLTSPRTASWDPPPADRPTAGASAADAERP